MVASFYDLIHKFKYCIQYIFIYFLLLLVLFLLVIPVLNIYPYIMFIIVIMGIIVAYCYKSKLLSLVLVSLWLSYISSYILYKCLYDGLASEDRLLIATLTLYFAIFISTCTKISHNIEIQKPNKTLYPERELDLNLIITTIKKESVNILGIESFWGMGKSLILDHFMYREKDSFAFIRIDVVALNIDDVLEYLVMQITSELEKQFVFSKRSRNFISYINNFKYGHLLTNLLGNESTYSSELESFKISIRKLNKPIIIIFEDLDRIDDKDVLRKIFYISERLTTDLSGKLKVIYQYNAKELNDKGFDNYYLQKYIPKTVQLTHIQFMKLVDYIVEHDIENCKPVIKYRQIIANLSNSITNWYCYSGVVIDPLDKERYLEAAYNIRNIEFFIKSLSFYIIEYSDLILKNSGFAKVLVQTFYIKYFLSRYYQTISTNFDIRSNFRINYEDNTYYIWNLIHVTTDQSIPIGIALEKDFSEDKIREIFSPKVNPINFEMFLAYCVLELYMYNLSGLDEPQSTNISIIETNYNSSASELNKNVRIKLKRLEHYFYTCIAAGNEAQSTHIIFANEFADKILSNDTIELTIFDEFMEYSFKKFAFEDTCFVGIDTWAAIFKSFYYASINWKEDIINSYYNKLILWFFSCYKNEFGDKFDLYLFRNLNVFLSGVQNYFLKNPFISMVKNLNYLEGDKGFSRNIYFIVFQENIIKSLIDLEYISDNYKKDLSALIYKSEVEVSTIILGILLSIKKEVDLIINEIKKNKEYDCFVYLDEMASIATLIDKLISLNKLEAQNYNHDEYKDSEFVEKKILSDEELAEHIHNNTIGARHLYDELKRRSISNINHK